MVGMPVSKA